MNAGPKFLEKRNLVQWLACADVPTITQSWTDDEIIAVVLNLTETDIHSDTQSEDENTKLTYYRV